MTEQKVAPYGSWKSPITPDLIVAETVVLREIAVDGSDIYWLEQRPKEGGRYVVVRRSADGRISDVTPAGFNARTTVHEYGGGSYLPASRAVYFSNFEDQRLYRQTVDSDPQPLTPAAHVRYADGVMDTKRGRIISVREDHRDSSREAVNAIVSVDTQSGGEGDVLIIGNDFYSNPRLNADASKFAWLSWSHPNMPWDGTELWAASVEADGTVSGSQLVAGGLKESVFQPEWSPDGSLYFVSDQTGWWNLYRWTGDEVRPVWPTAAEFGLPQWVFGMRTYAVMPNGQLVCSYEEAGRSRLAIIDPETGQPREIDIPYTDITGIRAFDNKVLFLGASPTEAVAVVQLELNTATIEVLRRSSNVDIEDGYCSVAEPIEFPTEEDLTAHAFYYAPRNEHYRAPNGERPPLLVISHGGPTGSSTSDLNLSIQFWTSRGIAVVDVNYGGSTGHGREYRERLRDRWGIVDVDDCVNAALYLVRRGEVDGERLAIRGGSAGGYTTLASLAFRDVFKAGASYYGVSDLEALAKDTHKFESRYLDGLIGSYPERRDLYMERSPIHHVDGFKAPMIILQGLEDKVVPPNQAEMIVEALKEKGIPVAYLPFEGEQHGFRHADNIRRALGAELYFYSRIFGFEPDHADPVIIENL